MTPSHVVTIDATGRLVIPKALRDEMGIVAGQPLDARITDGRLEIEPRPFDARLIERDGLLVITPSEPTQPLDRDEVRRLLESLRR